MGLFGKSFGKKESKSSTKPTPQQIFLKHVLDGEVDKVALLLQEGMSVFIRDKEGRTPLHLASWKGHFEIVRHLIAKGSEINERDNKGYTPLHLAKNRAIAKLLIDNRAVINAKRDGGNTPLHSAHNADVAKFLIEKGALVSQSNEIGETPLHTTMSIEVMQVLIENGIDINAKTNYGTTRLHRACQYGNTDIVKFLLTNNADVHAMDNHGCIPLHFASMNHLLPLNFNAEIVRLLTDYGADVNLKTDTGNSALDYAKKEGQTEIIAILENAAKKETHQQRMVDELLTLPSDKLESIFKSFNERAETLSSKGKIPLGTIDLAQFKSSGINQEFAKEQRDSIKTGKVFPFKVTLKLNLNSADLIDRAEIFVENETDDIKIDQLAIKSIFIIKLIKLPLHLRPPYIDTWFPASETRDGINYYYKGTPRAWEVLLLKNDYFKNNWNIYDL